MNNSECQTKRSEISLKNKLKDMKNRIFGFENQLEKNEKKNMIPILGREHPGNVRHYEKTKHTNNWHSEKKKRKHKTKEKNLL